MGTDSFEPLPECEQWPIVPRLNGLPEQVFTTGALEQLDSQRPTVLDGITAAKLLTELAPSEPQPIDSARLVPLRVYRPQLEVRPRKRHPLTVLPQPPPTPAEPDPLLED